MLRKIIEIDRMLCNGCGLCTTACAEGALELDSEGKATIVREIYCDGMGACLDVCPVDALRIVERESEAYDAGAAYAHVEQTRGVEAAGQVHGATRHTAAEVDQRGAVVAAGQSAHTHDHSGCPGSRMLQLDNGDRSTRAQQSSELGQWPIQLHLVSPAAPYFNGCDLLIAADCTAFALGDFHARLLKGKRLVIACPKLDQSSGYLDKLTALIRDNTVYSVTVAIMTVPCCSGLRFLVEEAIAQSGKTIAVRTVRVSMEGESA